MTDEVTEPQAVEPAIAAATPEEVVPSESAPEPVAEATPEETPERKESRGVQKRLDELTRNWREAERREAALLALLQQKPEAPKAEVKPEPVKTLADFEYDEAKYQAHLYEQVAKQATQAARREIEAEQRRMSEASRAESYKAREAKFAETAPDFREVVYRDDVPITPEMADVIRESEDGPALAYHLAKNVEIAESIARLSPLAQARELGRLEARLALEKQQVAEAKKRVSQAPPPAPKLEGLNAATSVSPDDPESDKAYKSHMDWINARQKQLSRSKR